MFAGVADWLTGQAHHASLLVSREHLVAGDDEGVHVGDTSSRGQDTVALAPTNDGPQHWVVKYIFISVLGLEINRQGRTKARTTTMAAGIPLTIPPPTYSY